MASTSCSMSFGVEDSFNRACVSSGNTARTAHTVFFSWPTKLDTVPQPLNAWNTGSVHAFSGSSPAAISWAAKYRKFFPVPKANQAHPLAVESEPLPQLAPQHWYQSFES